MAVSEIKAYKTEDGRIFQDEFKALTEDTEARLKTCLGQACAVEVMGKLLGVHAIIAPIASAMLARQDKQVISGEAAIAEQVREHLSEEDTPCCGENRSHG